MSESTLQLNQQGGGRIDIPLPESVKITDIEYTSNSLFKFASSSTSVETSSNLSAVNLTYGQILVMNGAIVSNLITGENFRINFTDTSEKILYGYAHPGSGDSNYYKINNKITVEPYIPSTTISLPNGKYRMGVLAISTSYQTLQCSNIDNLQYIQFTIQNNKITEMDTSEMNMTAYYFSERGGAIGDMRTQINYGLLEKIE